MGFPYTSAVAGTLSHYPCGPEAGAEADNLLVDIDNAHNMGAKGGFETIGFLGNGAPPGGGNSRGPFSKDGSPGSYCSRGIDHTDSTFDIRGLTSHAMVMWVRLNDTTSQPFIWSHWNFTAANQQAWILTGRVGVAGGPQFTMYDGLSLNNALSIKASSADETIDDTNWHMIGGGYNASTNKISCFWGDGSDPSGATFYYQEADGFVAGYAAGLIDCQCNNIGKFSFLNVPTFDIDHATHWKTRAFNQQDFLFHWQLGTGLTRSEFGSNPGRDTVAVHTIDNIELESAEYRNQDFTMSVMHKSDDPTAHPYSRPTLMTGDYTSDTFSPGDRDWSARYIRNYYTIPPENFWQWYRVHGHADAAAPYKKEDAMRLFYRLYKENQSHHIHGPTLTATAKDTANLIPMSFIAKDIPKVADVVQWDNILQMENFVVETKWVPSCPHMSWKITTNMFEVYGDANNYIRVSVLGASTPEREYNFEDTYAPHEPTWRLEKIKGGSSEFTKDFVLYHSYGGTGSAGEWMMEDTIKFQLIHFAGEICQLRIFKGELEGYVNFAAPVAFGSNLAGDFIIRGPGLWSAPLVRNTLDFTREATAPARVFPIGRNGFARRLQGPGRNPILNGERDPNVGTINAAKNNPFIAPESFTRGDDANLGTRWFNDQSTGNGWSIVSNKAECEELGWERYDHSPRHRDYIMDALVTLGDDNAYVGVFGRYERNRTLRTAYVARVHRTSVTAATLEIVRYWEGVAAVLSSDAFDTYAGATAYKLKMTLAGTTISAKVDAPAEAVYTGSTGVTTFTGSTVTDAPMTAGRVILEFTIAGVTYQETDDGSEGWNNVNGFVSGSSSINTTTGALELTFTVAPDNGTAINIIQTEASTSTTDIFLPKPGRLGIYGETDSAGELVQIDDYAVTRNHTVGIA